MRTSTPPASQPVELLVSFEDLDDSVIDEFNPFNRDPFDVVAALEEELGQSLWSS